MMGKERLVAFTDAVLAIIMTILVLDLDKPDAFTLAGFWISPMQAIKLCWRPQLITGRC